MTNKNLRINDFRRKLLHWYKNHHRNLPWRETHDPYKIWVAEVMLQQWVTLKDLGHYPLPSGSAKIIHFLEERDKIRRSSKR